MYGLCGATVAGERLRRRPGRRWRSAASSAPGRRSGRRRRRRQGERRRGERQRGQDPREGPDHGLGARIVEPPMLVLVGRWSTPDLAAQTSTSTGAGLAHDGRPSHGGPRCQRSSASAPGPTDGEALRRQVGSVRPMSDDRTATGPRDPEELEATGAPASAPGAAGTHPGAVHLGVADLDRSVALLRGRDRPRGAGPGRRDRDARRRSRPARAPRACRAPGPPTATPASTTSRCWFRSAPTSPAGSRTRRATACR